MKKGRKDEFTQFLEFQQQNNSDGSSWSSCILLRYASHNRSCNRFCNENWSSRAIQVSNHRFFTFCFNLHNKLLIRFTLLKKKNLEDEIGQNMVKYIELAQSESSPFIETEIESCTREMKMPNGFKCNEYYLHTQQQRHFHYYCPPQHHSDEHRLLANQRMQKLRDNHEDHFVPIT